MPVMLCREEAQAALSNVVHKRSRNTVHHDLVSSLRGARGKVDRVDLATTDREFVRINK